MSWVEEFLGEVLPIIILRLWGCRITIGLLAPRFSLHCPLPVNLLFISMAFSLLHRLLSLASMQWRSKLSPSTRINHLYSEVSASGGSALLQRMSRAWSFLGQGKGDEVKQGIYLAPISGINTYFHNEFACVCHHCSLPWGGWQLRFLHLPFPWHPLQQVAQGKIFHFNHCCEGLGCGWDWGCLWRGKEGERIKSRISVLMLVSLALIYVFLNSSWLTSILICLDMWKFMTKEYRPPFLLKYVCLCGERDWYLVLTRQQEIPETKG